MLNKLLRKYNKNDRKIKKMCMPAYNMEHIYTIKAERNIEVEATRVAKLVGKNINYRPLEIKSRRQDKTTEEAKCLIYKQTIPQYSIIKKLVENKNEVMTINKIDYEKLDTKIKELESKRDYNIDLLELDLYSAYIDEFYILKSYMDREQS